MKLTSGRGAAAEQVATAMEEEQCAAPKSTDTPAPACVALATAQISPASRGGGPCVDGVGMAEAGLGLGVWHAVRTHARQALGGR